MDREDWGSLAAFAVVAEECSFTRAAARLSVSPSARRFRDQVRVEFATSASLLASSERRFAPQKAAAKTRVPSRLRRPRSISPQGVARETRGISNSRQVLFSPRLSTRAAT